jgi:hypothetical protein
LAATEGAKAIDAFSNESLLHLMRDELRFASRKCVKELRVESIEAEFWMGKMPDRQFAPNKNVPTRWSLARGHLPDRPWVTSDRHRQ